MRPGPFAAGVLVLMSLPACSGVAAAAYAAADATYGAVVPRPGPSAVLLRGLFAVWSGLFFCWLAELAAGAAGQIAGRPDTLDDLLPGYQFAGEVVVEQPAAVNRAVQEFLDRDSVRERDRANEAEPIAAPDPAG